MIVVVVIYYSVIGFHDTCLNINVANSKRIKGNHFSKTPPKSGITTYEKTTGIQ